MTNIILDEHPNCNTDSEPELLVIHSPRIQQHAPWGDWARATAEWLRSNGWLIKRIGPDVHAMHPIMSQVH